MSELESVSIFDKKRLLFSLLDEMPGMAERLSQLGIQGMIEAGEVALAFEFICEQVDQDGIAISDRARDAIFALGEILQLLDFAHLVDGNPGA